MFAKVYWQATKVTAIKERVENIFSSFFHKTCCGCTFEALSMAANVLTFCMLGKFSFFLYADFFSKSTFLEKFRNTIRVSNSLDPDHAQCFEGWLYLITENLVQTSMLPTKRFPC